MSPYPEKLPIVPFTRPVRGSVTLPGSKSITNRALILAALSRQTVTLHGALFSRDTYIMVEALKALGFDVKPDPVALTITIVGQGGKIPAREATIQVGNAGTAARFLTAFVCLRPDGIYHFDGDEAMRRRPIGALLEALESQGAQASARNFPFTLRTAGLPGGTVELDASESSQLLSALLMVAPFSDKITTIGLAGSTVSKPFVNMTLTMMSRFQQGQYSVSIDASQCIFSIKKGSYALGTNAFDIESDATAASYFVALPIVCGGELRIPDYHPPGPNSDYLQGDFQFAQLLQREGVIKGLKDQQPTHTISGGLKKGITADFNTFSDTFLTLAAIAPLLNGKTTITGIAHTRKQETDRVAGVATELRKIIGKANITEETDSLEIRPIPVDEIRKRVLENGPFEIETYHDHRFAMSFAILGCYNLFGKDKPESWLTIKDPGCCAKTFPDFFDVLDHVRKNSHLR